MKKLNVLKINPERIITNQELKAINGGGWCVCHDSSGATCATGTWPCDHAWWYCMIACGGDFSWAACAGY